MAVSPAGGGSAWLLRAALPRGRKAAGAGNTSSAPPKQLSVCEAVLVRVYLGRPGPPLSLQALSLGEL